MIEVADAQRDVVNELYDFALVLIVDVLRLVGELVVIHVQAGREESDWNAPARIVVVITPAVDPLRVTVGIERIVERQRSPLGSVDRFNEISELG